MAARYTPPTDYDYCTGAERPFVLTYTVEAVPFYLDSGRREHVHVFVRWARREDLATVLAGTIDNKDGYGSEESAQAVGRCAADLLRQGIAHTYDLASWSDERAGVHFQWQQYDAERYCSSPRITAAGNDSIAAWETRVKFCRWLERLAKGDLTDPRTLLDALHRKGAVALLSWPERTRRYGEHRGPGGWIVEPHADALARLPVPARSSQAA